LPHKDDLQNVEKKTQHKKSTTLAEEKAYLFCNYKIMGANVDLKQFFGY
jgi:hypothetical protein